MPGIQIALSSADWVLCDLELLLIKIIFIMF